MNQTKETKVFFLYTLFYVLFIGFKLYSKYYIKIPSIGTITYRVFAIGEFAFLSLFFHHVLLFKFKKPIFISAFILFIAYSLYDYHVSSPIKYSFRPVVSEYMFFLIIILMFLYEKMLFSINQPVYYSPAFWIAVALLIGITGNFFLFLHAEEMIKDPVLKIMYNFIYDSFTILKNILLCTAIFVNNNNKNRQSDNSYMQLSNLDFDKINLINQVH